MWVYGGRVKGRRIGGGRPTIRWKAGANFWLLGWFGNLSSTSFFLGPNQKKRKKKKKRCKYKLTMLFCHKGKQEIKWCFN